VNKDVQIVFIVNYIPCRCNYPGHHYYHHHHTSLGHERQHKTIKRKCKYKPYKWDKAEQLFSAVASRIANKGGRSLWKTYDFRTKLTTVAVPWWKNH